jgi:hypothetical protein
MGEFSELHLDPTTGFVRGYSNTARLVIISTKSGPQYTKQFINTFVKVDGEHKEGKLKTLTLLQKPAIKQSTSYNKMIHTHTSEKQALLHPPKQDATKMTTCLVVTSITRIQYCSC